AKGYLVKQLKPDVYLITDSGYQSLFVTTGKGVILLDAPPSFGGKIVRAVSEVTKEPIVEVVYSHSHLDHIAGAPDILTQVPGLTILAEEGVAARGTSSRGRPRARSRSRAGRAASCGYWKPANSAGTFGEPHPVARS